MRVSTIITGYLPIALTSYKFNTGDILIAADLNKGNFTRFDGDISYSIPPKATIRVVGLAKGDFSSKNERAEFAHSSFGGKKYYEVACDEGFINNFTGKQLHSSNTLYILASNLEDDNLFLKFPHRSRRAA